MSEIINISAYKFVDLDRLQERKASLLPFCRQLGLRGTILLSTEGINLFVAGDRRQIDQFMAHIHSFPEFADLKAKESPSDYQPFSRMLVRIKKEIISMGVESIRPRVKTSPKLQAKQLKAWLDEGRPVTLYDVRNDYEYEVGTFKNAIPAGIDSFRDFPEATSRLPDETKQQPLVMFCTGGIRCEKAGPLMEEQGFEEIYQLDGGILKYFEECGGAHWDGDCFVFDKRVAVSPDLEESDFEQCYGCQAVLSVEDQQSPHYQPPHACPYCYQSEQQKMRSLLGLRDQQLAELAHPLPGSQPYNNVRPMNVPLRFDHHTVLDFLVGMHAHLSPEYWQAECDGKRIVYKSQALAGDTPVRAGWRIEHLIPHTTEPDVNADVEFLYEDDVLIAVNKPAPLPMHPCGRFNRNSLKYLLGNVYAGEQIRILHRLDSNTTGVVLLARKRAAAKHVHRQFERGAVEKIYLAKVQGHPSEDKFHCDAAIGDRAQVAGSRIVDADGQPALTEFEVLQRDDDGTALVMCLPKTGRTNQIRIHLSHLGFPIIGDPTYLADGDANETQTLDVDSPPMCLHAWQISLLHPVEETEFKVKAPLPDWANLNQCRLI